MTTSLAPARRTSPRRAASRTLLYAVLGFLTLVVVFPLVWMVLTSFKTDADAVRNP